VITPARIGPAQAETLPARSRRPRDDPGDPRLEPVGQRRNQQRDAKHHQDCDRDRALDVVGQAERVDHVDERDRGEREGEDQADDDAERPAASAGDAGPQDRGKNRQHAGRERGAGARKEREGNQQDHPEAMLGRGG
jgi:hypothetical protein